MQFCPCGSKIIYSQCCGLYLNKQAKPSTPEALMRSRYTAYTLADIAYIKKTMREKALIGFDEKQAKQWASSVHWLGLEVIVKSMHPTNSSIGYVEFIAKYLDNHIIKTIHEISEFHCIAGEWFYVDGKYGGI
jgi:SEC-C motif-containing protein